MSIKILDSDLNVLGTISENGVALEDKYVSKDEEVLTQEVICSHSGEITGNTNDEHGLAIEDQQMIISKIEGQTLIANNLVSFENATTQTINGVTFTVNREAGTVLANGTATDTATFFFGCILNAYKNHKYLISAGRLFDEDANQGYFGSGGWQVFRDFGSGGIISSREENTLYQDIAIVLKAGFVANNLLFVPQIIDLTLMFGYGNEPTLDEWKAMNMPLIPYSTGYVLNSKVNLLSTTKNVCPRGQWILGEWYDNYTGDVSVADSSMIRFDAKIYVTNNIKYYLWTSKAFSSWQMFCYDSNDKYLGIGGDVGPTSGITPLLSTSYIRVAIWTDSSIDDGRIPAEYNVTPFERIAEPLPYQSGELVIDQELGEWEYIDNNSNTKHSRVKSIDLGDLDYVYGADYQYFVTNITNAAPNIYSEDSDIINWVKCSRYSTASNNQIYLNTLDMSIGVHKNSSTNNYYLNIRDSRYTDPILLRNSLAGVKLYYLSNQEEVTSLEEPIAGGMPVWNGGQQSQVGQLPYILNKQYSLSLSAQVAANIQIDREQQTQINMFNQKVQGFATQDAINTACDELYEQVSQDIQTEINDIQAPQSSINAPFLIQPFIGATRAMRLFGLPSDQVIVEASTDNGQTWTSTNEADWTKDQLFLQTRASSIKIPLKDNKKSCDCLLRVTITGMKYDVPEGLSDSEKYQYWNSNYALTNERYCSLDFGYFWVNALTDRIYIEHQYSTGASPDNWIVDGILNRAQGWTGGNYVKFGGGVTFGGGTTQIYNGWNHRFIFRTQASDGSFDDSKLNQSYLTSAQDVYEISCYGQNCWTASNNMMNNDRPYTVNYNMAYEFDGGVSTPKNIWATGNISSGSYIDATGQISAKGGFVFSGQTDQDKKLLTADGWWKHVDTFATAEHTHSNYASTSYVDTACNGVYSQVSNELTPINNKLAKVSMDSTTDTLTISSTTLNLSGNTIASSLESDEIQTPTLEAEKVHTNSLTILTADPNNANSTIIAGTIQPKREPQQGYGSNGHVLNISPLYSSIITTPHLYLSSSDYSAALTYDDTNRIINCGVQFKAPSLTVTDSVKIGNSVLQNDQIQGFSSVNEALISNMPINASSFLADNSLRITSQGFETTISNTANGAEQSLHIDHSLTVAGKLSVQDRIDAASMYVNGVAVATKQDTSFALLSSTSAPGEGGTLIGGFLANYNDVMFIIENHHTQPVTASIAYADNGSAVTALTYTVPANTTTAISAYRYGTTGGIFTVAGVACVVPNITICRLITNLSTASIKLYVVGR